MIRGLRHMMDKETVRDLGLLCLKREGKREILLLSSAAQWEIIENMKSHCSQRCTVKGKEETVTR